MDFVQLSAVDLVEHEGVFMTILQRDILIHESFQRDTIGKYRIHPKTRELFRNIFIVDPLNMIP